MTEKKKIMKLEWLVQRNLLGILFKEMSQLIKSSFEMHFARYLPISHKETPMMGTTGWLTKFEVQNGTTTGWSHYLTKHLPRFDLIQAQLFAVFTKKYI